MICVGQTILFRVCCPECGEPQQQGGCSDFFIFICQNEECVIQHAPVMVERKTGIVLSVEGRYRYNPEAEKWEQLFPSLYDKDGRQIWPEVCNESFQI